MEKLLEIIKSSSNQNFQSRAINFLRDKNYNPVKSKEIVEALFVLLPDIELGSYCAEYLSSLEDSEIIKKSLSRIENFENDIEQINLCQIISSTAPEKVYAILFNKLNNYETRFQKPLMSALSKLNEHYMILTDLLKTLNLSDDLKYKELILGAIEFSSHNVGEIEIEYETFEKLFILWEDYHDLGNLYWFEQYVLKNLISRNCYSVSKEYLFENLNKENYKYRVYLLEIIVEWSISRNDVSDTTLEWLINLIKMEIEIEIKTSSFYEYILIDILGKICNEDDLTDKITPLLNSNNAKVSSSAYKIIKRADRLSGKRRI